MHRNASKYLKLSQNTSKCPQIRAPGLLRCRWAHPRAPYTGSPNHKPHKQKHTRIRERGSSGTVCSVKPLPEKGSGHDGVTIRPVPIDNIMLAGSSSFLQTLRLELTYGILLGSTHDRLSSRCRGGVVLCKLLGTVVDS